MKPSISLYEKHLADRFENQRKNISTVTAICVLAAAATLTNTAASLISLFNDSNGWPPALVAFASSILLVSLLALLNRLHTARNATMDRLDQVRRYRRDLAIHAPKHTDSIAALIAFNKTGRHL